jgi:hypothetical protein
MGRTPSRPEQWFFFANALIFLAIVLVGFGPTLYLREAFGTIDRASGSADLPTYLLVHGIVLTAWYTLFLGQTLLARLGRPDWHRRMGVVGLVLALMVLWSGAQVTYLTVPRMLAGMSAAGADPAIQQAVLQGFSRVIVGNIHFLVVFTVFVGTAAWLRRKTDVHKRLMLLASAYLIGPALSTARPIGQPIEPLLPHGVLPSMVFMALCAAALFVYDYATKRRIHPATMWGTAIIGVSVAARIHLVVWGDSGLAFTRWMVGL